MDNGSEIERIEGEDGKQILKVSKIPLEDLLNILENLYEVGTNFIDMEFFIDPKEIQSVITITTRPEYMASPEQIEEENKMFEEYEEDDDDDEDDIMNQIRNQQEESNDTLSDEDLNELI